MFERQPDGAVDDENTHGKRQQAKGGQVQVKAIRQPRDIATALGGLQGEVGGDGFKGGTAHRLAAQTIRRVNFACLAQQTLCDANIRDGGIGGDIRT